MIYYYTVRVAYYKNNKKIILDYKLDFSNIIEFLYEKQKHNSSMEIIWIKPYYRSNNFYE